MNKEQLITSIETARMYSAKSNVILNDVLNELYNNDVNLSKQVGVYSECTLEKLIDIYIKYGDANVGNIIDEIEEQIGVIWD